nr:polysaccharide biosynthesis C-terminal domain-containing protein [Alphaproteobacteria bacterium]
ALKVSLVVTIYNIALAFLLIWPLMPMGAGHVAIALATSLAGWLNVWMLSFALRKRDLFALDDNCKRNVMQMLLAAGAMAIVLLLLLNITQDVFTGFNEFLRLATLGGICAIGGAVYIGLCFKLGALKWDEVKSFLKPVKKDPDMQMAGTE